MICYDWLMRFVIKADAVDLALLLETAEYRSVWRQYGRCLRQAFKTVTGLDFQQQQITARVSQVAVSSAGNFYEPMRLSADIRSRDNKLLTMVHELCHRLLSGNGLGEDKLHRYSEADLDGDIYSEAEHFNTYLFEYDVVRQALGDEWGERCIAWEDRDDNDPDVADPHVKAWRRAMQLSYQQRQQATHKLAERAIPRSEWHKLDDDGNLLPEFERNNP